MANYTCEFSKIKDGDSTKYVQVPNENTAKRDTLVFADDFNHTPLRNLDKYKITKTISVDNPDYDGNDEKSEQYIITTVTYVREFKSDQKGVVTGDGSGTDFIFCAFKQEKGNNDNVIYIKHDDLTNAENDKPDGKYPVWIKTESTNDVSTFTIDTTTYTFLWL